MTETRLEKLKRVWEKRRGVTEKTLAAFVEKVAPVKLPAGYLDLMRFSNGGKGRFGAGGLYLGLDRIQKIRKNSRIYRAPPHLLLIGELTGMNPLAGLVTLGLDLRTRRAKFVWMYGFHFEELQPLGATLEEALKNLAPLARRLKRESDTADLLDVIYVPTPNSVLAKMIETARIQPGELVYDLGSGDGRVVIKAAKECGARCVGFDIERERIKEARANARAAGVQRRVTFKRQNLFDVDLSQADVITMYLLPQLLQRLLPKVKRLKPGVRIVSHQYRFEGYEPDELHEVPYNNGQMRYVRLWTLPLRKRKDAEDA